MQYTFQTDWKMGTYREWIVSSQRFDSLSDACMAAQEWMYACAINGQFPSVQIVKIEA